MEHKMTPTIGRSHGIHAEPTTFGVKLAGFYAEMARNRKRLEIARDRDLDLRHFGAVDFREYRSAHRDDGGGQGSASRSSLISTQVIPRDRHAAFFAALGVVASTIERIATEIRHLQRTEVLEAEEYSLGGQKGSVRHARTSAIRC